MDAVPGKIKRLAKGRKAVICKDETSSLEYKKYSHGSDIFSRQEACVASSSKRNHNPSNIVENEKLSVDNSSNENE